MHEGAAADLSGSLLRCDLRKMPDTDPTRLDSATSRPVWQRLQRSGHVRAWPWRATYLGRH